MDSAEISVIEKELEISYLSFFRATRTLLEELSPNNDNLLFAVIDVQICLELFLKYYLVKTGNWQEVVNTKKNERKYRDYFEVLISFFKTNSTPYVSFKELKRIGEKRNAIVHRGKFTGWDKDMAEIIITSIFFIQGTLMDKFQKSLLQVAYASKPSRLANNQYWVQGAVKFSDSLSKKFSFKVLKCAFCEQRAFVPKEVFGFDEIDIDGYQCLACVNGK